MQHAFGSDRKCRHRQEPRQMAICKLSAPRANIHELSGACNARNKHPRAFQPASLCRSARGITLTIGGFN